MELKFSALFTSTWDKKTYTLEFKRISKDNYNDYSIKQHQNFHVVEWLVGNNESVKKEQPIAKIKFLGGYSVLPSPEDGIIEIKFRPNINYPTQEEDVLFGIYGDIPSMLNSLYEDFTTIKDINCNNYFLPKYENCEVKFWLVSEGEVVEKGQAIFTIRISSIIVSHSIEKTIYSPESGVIEILMLSGQIQSKINKKSPVFSIYTNNNDRLSNRYQNSLKIEIDDFTKDMKMYWSSIGTPDKIRNQSSIYLLINELKLDEPWICLPYNLGLSIENINGKDYLLIVFEPKKFKINPDDKMFFLLDNDNILDFTFAKKSFTINNQRKGIHIPIYKEEIEVLSKVKIIKIRFQNKEDGENIDISTGRIWYNKKEDFQYVFQNLFIEYIQAIKDKLENYNPISIIDKVIKDKEITEENCYIYLMHDTINNFYKIGISNSPYYREKTLQSEKPSIELIAYKNYPSRKIAHNFEQALHLTYKDSRIRGEWFELSQKEIQEIVNTLK